MKRKDANAAKAELIAALAGARGRLLEAARAVPAGRRDEAFLGTWSLKELLAHLAGWDGANREAVDAILAGRLPPFYAHHDRDWRTFNAQLVARHRREDFDALLAEVEASHRGLIERLEAIPAEEFERDRGLRFKGYRVTIARILRAEASDEGIHCRQIEAFTQTVTRRT